MFLRSHLMTSGKFLLPTTCMLLAAPVTFAAPPSGTLSYTYFSSADFEDGDGKVKQQDIRLTVPAGTFGSPEDSMFLMQVNVAERQFKVEDTGFMDQTLRVYDISMPLRFRQQLASGDSFSFGANPSIRSSLDDIQSEDFTFSNFGQYTWDAGNHNYSLGLMYGRLLGADRLIPIGGYSYKGVSNLEVTLGFPATGVRYFPEKTYSYFAGLFPYGGSWHVYDDGHSNRDYYLRQTGFRVGAGITFDVGGPFEMQLEAGRQVGQRLEIDDSHGFDTDIEHKYDIDDSSYVGVSFNLKAL